MHINIEIHSDNPLIAKEYSFYYLDNVLYLDYYAELSRATKRHKFKNNRHYSRLRTRESNMKEHEVPLTDEIKKLAIQKFMDKLSVKKWEERHGL